MTRRVVGVPLLLVVAALTIAHSSWGAVTHVPIGYVKVDYVTQPPGRPVVIRILIKAPRALTVRVGYTILDRSGKRIYEQTSRPFKTHFLFDVSSVVLRWQKKDANGRLVPARYAATSLSRSRSTLKTATATTALASVCAAAATSSRFNNVTPRERLPHQAGRLALIDFSGEKPQVRSHTPIYSPEPGAAACPAPRRQG
jgi:hypothetical protein